MKFELKTVNTFNRTKIPEEHETISDDVDIASLLPHIIKVDVYLRNPDECPKDRGNWMIDFGFKNGDIFSLKLPIQMTTDQIDRYMMPLTDILNGLIREKMH